MINLPKFKFVTRKIGYFGPIFGHLSFSLAFTGQHYNFFHNRKLISDGNILECLKSFIINVMNMKGHTVNYSFSIYCEIFLQKNGRVNSVLLNIG